MDLEKIFRSVARRLRSDFDDLSAEIQHRSAKGAVREQMLVREFLRRVVPSLIGIDRGEIVSVDGQVSSETDVVFYDSRTAPKFIDEEGFCVLPVECVYGMIEVKSHLDSRELSDAANKIAKFKGLEKTALAEQKGPIVHTFPAYGREWGYYPCFGMVFAYGSISPDALLGRLAELDQSLEPHKRIDSVWVLDEGMIVNREDDGMIERRPTPTSHRAVISSENPLLLLTVHLQQLLQVLPAPRFNILDYFGKATFGQFLEPPADPEA